MLRALPTVCLWFSSVVVFLFTNVVGKSERDKLDKPPSGGLDSAKGRKRTGRKEKQGRERKNTGSVLRPFSNYLAFVQCYLRTPKNLDTLKLVFIITAMLSFLS